MSNLRFQGKPILLPVQNKTLWKILRVAYYCQAQNLLQLSSSVVEFNGILEEKETQEYGPNKMVIQQWIE